PGPDFQKGGEKISLISTIKRRLQGFGEALNYILLASLALIIPGIVIPGFSKIFIDDILIGQIQNWFLPLLVGMVITGLMRAIFSWLQQIHLLRLQTQLLLTNTVKFLQHVLRLPIVFFSQRYKGDISERISANDRLASLLSGDVSTSIVSLFSMVFYALVMLLVSWPIALISIIAALINAGLLYYVAQRIADKSYGYLQERGKLVGLEMHGLQIIETLKASAAEDAFFQRWAGYHARTINSQQQIAFYELILELGPQLLNALTTMILLGLGGWLVMHGHLTIGSLVALQSLLVSFNMPLSTLVNLGGELQQIRGDLARLDDVLQHPEDSRLQTAFPDTLPITKLNGSLTFKNINFGYSPLEPPFIQDFNLSVPTGTRVAIVGATGSGKTTIAKLVAGLYQPTTGTVYLDDFALPTISPARLAHSLTLVDQDIFLFEGSVRDNLTLWNPNISDAAIEQALHDACLIDVIATRGGLEAKIAEGGTNLSGGQRQRLEIARALATNPSLLILDEATSALDPIMEKQIYDNLHKRGCTLLIIAHRLSAIRDCDQIIVLANGKIAQQGRHEKLMRQEGLYKKLYETD
ncbi:MAG TPA: ATP-binding cassette domain-containing protein, partial [Bacteroidia bacterium]|nr:ATP-binding cassette domain-containing protein [Bacteroidia bacterium]